MRRVDVLQYAFNLTSDCRRSWCFYPAFHLSLELGFWRDVTSVEKYIIQSTVHSICCSLEKVGLGKASIVLAILEDRKMQNEFVLHLKELEGDGSRQRRYAMYLFVRLSLFTWFYLCILKVNKLHRL